MSEDHGTITWNELATGDVAAAKAYYAAVCGWTYDEMPMQGGGTYIVARIGDRMIAGIFDMATMRGAGDAPQWLTYIAVDDVDRAAEQTGEVGGTVLRAPWDVPGVGRIAIVADPTGAVLGLMTPSEAA